MRVRDTAGKWSNPVSRPVQDCAELPPPPKPAVCADGLDNDGDGYIDYPSDPDCVSASDPDEAAPATTAPPSQPTPPEPSPATPPPPSSACDPSYPTVCIPPPPPDLDCADIPYTNFVVLPPDPHHFDGDHDGVGCER